VIEYSSTRTVRPADVLRLLRQTAWGIGRTEADVATALRAAPIHVGAWSDGRLVGFARAITDGVYRSFIEDVVVEESLRGKGVGRRLVRELLALFPDVKLVALDCPSELVPFYAGLGFEPSANTRMEVVPSRRG
jgi:predicted GNAT family N-acyltransferase